MRLWHKELIPVLPRQQLLSQWRECCCIARSISENGTPNHILVNKIMDYPREHFIAYTRLVRSEMIRRGYKCDGARFTKWMGESDHSTIGPCEIFLDWHNDRYLKQCYHNLEEKADCGGMSRAEWYKIQDHLHFLERDL